MRWSKFVILFVLNSAVSEISYRVVACITSVSWSELIATYYFRNNVVPALLVLGIYCFFAKYTVSCDKKIYWNSTKKFRGISWRFVWLDL